MDSIRTPTARTPMTPYDARYGAPAAQYQHALDVAVAQYDARRPDAITVYWDAVSRARDTYDAICDAAEQLA